MSFDRHRSGAPTPSVGDVFAERYEITGMLGAGGMGAVYEVLDQATHRHRALKLMHPMSSAHDTLRERFRREATVAAGIDSEHVAEVLDAGIDDATGAPFIVMERLKGQDLAQLLNNRGPLPADEVVFYLSQAALALDKAHAGGIVHRDLKPENLFVTHGDDGTPRIKILDFGIAKVMTGSAAGETRGMVGTPIYAAPEQIHGESEATERSDVFACAMIVYALLVGEPYWSAEREKADNVYGLMFKLGAGPRQAASERARGRTGVTLSEGFDAWFARATALDPAARFHGVGEAVDELARVLGVERRASAAPGHSVELPPAVTATRGEPTPPPLTHTVADGPSGKGGRGLAMGAMGLVILALGAGYVLTRSSDGATTGPTSASQAKASPHEGNKKKKKKKKKKKGKKKNESAALKQPKLGLAAIAAYTKPSSAVEASLRSASYWKSAAADFASVAKQDGAPARWKAGQAFAEGQALLQSGRPEAAIPKLDAAATADAEWPLPHCARSSALLWLGKTDEALAAAQKAERLDPKWWWAPAEVGKVLTHLKRTDDAVGAFRRALALSPKEPILLAGLAIVYHGARLDTEAERYAKLALAEDENTFAAHIVLAERAREDKDGKLALDHASRAVAVVPDHISALLALADAHRLLGNEADALAQYKKAVSVWEKKHERLGPTERLQKIRIATQKGELPPAESPAAAPSTRGRGGEPPRTKSPGNRTTTPEHRGTGDVDDLN